MKTLLQPCLHILFLLGVILQLGAEELPEAKHLIQVPREISTASGTLHFIVEGRRVVLLDAKDLQVFWFDSLESVKRVVMNEDQSTILILVHRLWDGSATRKIRAFSYSKLVLLQRDRSGKWSDRVYLPQNRLPMEERGRTIADLRTVSDDGRSAVVKFGEYSENAPGRMNYDWRTIDLWTGNTLENADKPEREVTAEVKVP